MEGEAVLCTDAEGRTLVEREGVVVEELQGDRIVVQFRSGRTEEFERSLVSEIQDHENGLLRVRVRMPMSMKLVKECGPQPHPREVATGRAFEWAREQVWGNAGLRQPQKTMAQVGLREMESDGIIPQPQHHNRCGFRLRKRCSGIQWPHVMCLFSILLCCSIWWPLVTLLQWKNSHPGRWTLTSCNITAFEGLELCNDIPTTQGVLQRPFYSSVNYAQVPCCRLLVFYKQYVDYHMGYSIENATLLQPASLSESKYEPDPCHLATGKDRLCRYTLQPPQVETSKKFKVLSERYPGASGKLLAAVFPALYSQTPLHFGISGIALISIAMLLYTAVWALTEPEGSLVADPTLGDVEVDHLSSDDSESEEEDELRKL